MSGLVEGAGGNREVPALDLLGTRRDLRAARVAAYLKEEGGSREHYASWYDTSGPKGRDEAAERAVELAA